MTTLPEAIRAVLAGTAAAGVAGGILGAILGRAAPAFLSKKAFGTAGVDPVETGLALGAIGGLVLGAAGCTVLASVKMLAEARVERARAREETP